ncbi:MAG: alpha/beta hydrolase [Pseudomonadota bacterium]
MAKIVKRRSLLLAAFLFIFTGTIFVKKFGFPPYYQTEQAVLELKKQSDFFEKKIDTPLQKIQLVQSGNPNNPPILFTHGSPGRWHAWADYLLDNALKEKAFMIAIDRPGFGFSDIGTHQPSLQKQAKVILDAVQSQLGKDQKMIVVGHSYGGPVALRLAVDYPEKIQSLILLAPSIDPDLEDNRWFNKLASWPVVRALLPKAVDRSNQEILVLQGELEAMKPLLKNLQTKVSIIQGAKDTLVPPGNATYGKEQLAKSDVGVKILAERGHFIPWQEYDLVKKTLFEHLSDFY